MSKDVIEEDFIGIGCWPRIVKCPGCNERLLMNICVTDNAYVPEPGTNQKIGQVQICLEKIPQGNCRDCVSQTVPEYQGIIGAKEAAFCGADDLSEGEEHKKYPQHTWTLEEMKKGINKHTWRSIEALKKAQIKDLKCIEFCSQEQLKQNKKDWEERMKKQGG